MSQPNYRINPSQLNAFQRYLDSEVDAEAFSNFDENGEYKHTPDEIAAEREQALIDLINKVEQEPSEAADRGTCLNEIIDCIVLNEKSTRDDVIIKSAMLKHDDETEQPCIFAKMHDFSFNFDMAFCKSLAEYYAGSIAQHFCSANIDVYGKLVELYGYIDYIMPNGVVDDLKTTTRYDFGKYEHGWQKTVYPYCLIESREMVDVATFEYNVAVLKGGTNTTPIISGTMYKEEYKYNHEKARIALQQMLERFIGWLENHRSVITNTKIFGAEE